MQLKAYISVKMRPLPLLTEYTPLDFLQQTVH